MKDFNDQGYIVRRNVIPKDLVEEAKKKAAELYKNFGMKGGLLDKLVHRDPFFLQLSLHENIKKDLRTFMNGERMFVYHSHGILRLPVGGRDTVISPHRDNGTRTNKNGLFNYIKAGIHLTDCGIDSCGNTYVYPGSHTLKEPPFFGSAVPILAAPGDVLYYLPHLYHSASHNRQKGVRMAVFFSYTTNQAYGAAGCPEVL